MLAINKDGNIVFAEPKPMCTVRVPKGHTGWVYIELTKISPQTTACENYLCLGIRRRGENEIIGPLYSIENHTSKYVGLADDEVMELVPMLSKTKLSEKYTETITGEEVDLANFTDSADEVFDFGSVYRINMKYHGDILWIRKECDLKGNTWSNFGYIDRGLVNDKENQLLIINWNDSQLKSSSDGIHWEDAGNIRAISCWDTAPKYGNGIWCVANFNGEVRRSTDGSKTWQVSTNLGSRGAYSFIFCNGLFMSISLDGKIHTSVDGINWEHLDTPLQNFKSDHPRILGYGNGKWICNDANNVIFSTNGKEWSSIDSNLMSLLHTPNIVSGGTYANGNFYAIDPRSEIGSVFRSSDGKVWERAFNFSCGYHDNITYLGDKLYMLSYDGTHYHLGLFYPNDTYDSL